jgi:methylenetetrahydrofolate reductase (NADPH)
MNRPSNLWKERVSKMLQHIRDKIYHVEILPPKQETEKLDADLQLFAEKYNRVMQSGYCACITDNAMGHLAFQGTEIIEEMGLTVYPQQVMIHLNTFHTKEDLHNILNMCQSKGVKYLLIITGDGSDRLPKLQPVNIDATGIESVTSVDLIRYIHKEYPNTFILGAAFNPYEPPEHEFAKMERKITAGAAFVITQPVIEKNAVVDALLEKYPDLPVIVEAWMSKKLYLLSDAVGYQIPENTEFDPIATLKLLHGYYPKCGVYLSLLGFKTQYHLIKDTWQRGQQ